jgi:hypothetical protein
MKAYGYSTLGTNMSADITIHEINPVSISMESPKINNQPTPTTPFLLHNYFCSFNHILRPKPLQYQLD